MKGSESNLFIGFTTFSSTSYKVKLPVGPNHSGFCGQLSPTYTLLLEPSLEVGVSLPVNAG